MKVLVTGGAGFIGSHLVDRLMSEGHQVTVVDNLHRGREENIRAHVQHPQFSFQRRDIRRYDGLEALCSGQDVVYHLAAQSNVMGAVSNMDYSFETNVIGTFNMLKAAKAGAVKRFIFTSSREAYGEARYLPVNEEHPLDAKNAYGASKAAGEKYCQVFQNTFGMATVILRLANVYGPRDFDRVIPIFMERVKAGKNLQIYGGKQVIDFISVEIVVQALMQAATNEQAVLAPTNIGSGTGTTLFELAERIIKLLGGKSRIDLQPARSQEVVRYTADTKRMHTVFDLNCPQDALYFLPQML